MDRDGKARHLPIHKMVPNLLTLTALAAGLTSIQFALDSNWDRAVIALLAAAILDALDGATARLLGAASDFGAQLDSLSDFLSFGITPALILYLWVLEDAGPVGWIALLVFAAASALRLARFTAAKTEAEPEWKRRFFGGVPTPAGAGIAILPMLIWLQIPDVFESLTFATPLVGVWVIVASALMVSRIPTWSLKSFRLPARMAMPALAFAALLIAALIQAPWQTLSVAILFYLGSIPFSLRHFIKLQKRHRDAEAMSDIALGAAAIDTFSNPQPQKDDPDA